MSERTTNNSTSNPCPYTKEQILAVCVDGYCKYLLNSNLNPNSARSTKRATLGAATVCNIMKTSKAVANSIDGKMYGAMYDDACASERCDRSAADQRTAGDLVVLDKRDSRGDTRGDRDNGNSGFSRVKKHVESRLMLARLPADFDRSMRFLKLSADTQSRIRERLNGYDSARDDFDKYARTSGIYDLVALSINGADFESYVNIYLAGLRAALLDQYAADDRLYSAVESAPTLAELMEVHQLDCERCVCSAKLGDNKSAAISTASSTATKESFGESSSGLGSSVLDSVVANIALLEAAENWPKQSDHKIVIGAGVNKMSGGGYEVDLFILMFVVFVVLIIILIMRNLRKIEHVLGFEGGNRHNGESRGGIYWNPAVIAAVGGNKMYGGNGEDNGSSDMLDSEDPLFVSTPEDRSFE